MRDDEQPGRTDAAVIITTASSNNPPPPSLPSSAVYAHGVLLIMDQFNDWHHPPAITYDPNGFIANLDPAYISAAERVPANTTDPTPNLPTSSQRCLQLLPEDIRQAYKIAYEAIKRSIGQHQRPDWDLIWLEAVLSPPGLVKDALKAHFDKLFIDSNQVQQYTLSPTHSPPLLTSDHPRQLNPLPEHSSTPSFNVVSSLHPRHTSSPYPTPSTPPPQTLIIRRTNPLINPLHVTSTLTLTLITGRPR
ncbi:hypothetical protein CF335_g6807 [Tilletia laevis]|nr:hypothetical protein CF335_g6807 [Tilletia laevis]